MSADLHAVRPATANGRGMHLLQLADQPATPWKNGGGLTRELLCWPSAADWQLRISVAEIKRSGPFSAYPGVARWFCVLQGAGVRLQMPGDPQSIALTPASPPLHFDGALAPGCTLTAGPTLDLNLMARHGAVRSQMSRAVAGERWTSPAQWRGVFTMHAATLHGATDAPLALPPGTLAWCDDASAPTWWLESRSDNPSAAWWLACALDTASTP